MKIRTQFVLLLIALFLIPIFMLGTLVLSSWFRTPSHIFVPSWEVISQKEDVNHNEEEWDKIRAYIDQLPNAVDVAVLSETGNVLLSSIPEILVGTNLTEAELMNVFSTNTDDHMYQIDKNFRLSEDNMDTNPLILVTRMLKEDRYKWDVVIDQLRAIINVFSILLFLCISGIIYLSHVLSRSMEVLEKETRNLAKGNLNKEIQVRGNNEILSLTNSLNSMRLSLLEEQKRRSWLIMGISHDLRTPLALIKGYTEAIIDGTADSPEMRAKSLEIVEEKVDQLDSMIDDLINFVRMDYGEWKQSLEPLPITTILKDYASRLEDDGRILGRIVTTNIDLPDNIEIPLDERLMIRVLDNLCGNAIHYTPQGGTVTLSASLFFPTKKRKSNSKGSKNSTSATIILKVQDNGYGISPEDQPHVFDPFFRGDNSLKSEGKGLGLAVVKTVADGLGWTIDLKSKKNKGSCFTISIPVKGFFLPQDL